MARGRMLSTEASVDPELHTISVQAMALYLLTIPHLDRDGLIDGRPMRLGALVAPMRPELVDQAGSYINEWVQAGLVVRYDGEKGRPCLFFKGFRQHQQGMEYDREPPSRLPPPPGWIRIAKKGLVPNDPELCFRLSEQFHIKSAYRAALLAAAKGDVPGSDEAFLEDVADGLRAGIANPSRTHREDIANTSRRSEDKRTNDDDDDHTSMPPSPSSVSENTRARASALPDLSSLLVQYSDEELRTVADNLGGLIGLNVEWDGWDKYLAACDRSTLFRLLGWIQRWRSATEKDLLGVKSLTAVIRAAVRDGKSARLIGYQLDELAGDIERVLLLEATEVDR